MKTLFRFVPVLAILLQSASISRASFAIMPMEVKLQLQGQEKSVTSDIEVYNGGDALLHISGSVSDWKLTPNGDYEYSDAGTEKLSCANWIQLNPPEFNLGPKKSVHVRYTVTVPETVTRERRAMVFFASRPVPLKGDKHLGVMVAMRMGCKVFLSPAEPLAKACKISDMELIDGAPQRVRLGVQNTADVTFRATGTIQIRDAADALVAQGQFKSAQVVPDAGRNLWFDLPITLAPGQYTLRATVDFTGPQLLGGVLKVRVPEMAGASPANVPPAAPPAAASPAVPPVAGTP